MEIDWSALIWQARWSALEMFWNAVIVDVGTYWWFWPLLLVLILTAGWKAVARFAIYVTKVFVHTHERTAGPSRQPQGTHVLDVCL